ncbi:MAG: dihydroorotate dehydrogenase electron transfer subunit, partial [Mycobacterium sp.]|nr:dihydroorotate dehydrogenase electron transfer subunit [Mycobacterium sp.]
MLQPLASEKPARARPVSLAAPVVLNEHVHDRYWRLRLDAPQIAAVARAGQFVLLTPSHTPTAGPSLPRPMAVYDVDRSTGVLDILYGVVGEGTSQLTTFRRGESMTVVGPLGRPFQLPAQIDRLLLVGRGIGTCSLTLLAREQAESGVAVSALLSGRRREAIVGADLSARLGAQVSTVSDEEGTSSVERVRSLLLSQHDAAPPQLVATCGSERLLMLCRELRARWRCEAQASVEAHMACGLGYCHGCAAGQQG